LFFCQASPATNEIAQRENQEAKIR
jgi:hypothetical protein